MECTYARHSSKKQRLALLRYFRQCMDSELLFSECCRLSCLRKGIFSGKGDTEIFYRYLEGEVL